MNLILIYLIILNIYSLIICLIDKLKAIKGRYRISERYLLLISFAGGCFGFFLGMLLFHHKTKKRKFYLLIPLMIILWLLMIFYYLFNLHRF